MDNTIETQTKVPRDFESLRSTIIERKNAMPKRLAQVAAFALSNPDEIAFGTTASIAAAAEVQPSTLVRLAHHLGYEGFSDLQSIFRERLRDRTLSYEERLVTLERSGVENEEASILSGFLSAASQSVNKLAATIETDTFAKAVDVLAAAETIYLIAKRRSYPLTAHMTYAFSKLNIRHQIVASPNGIDGEITRFATEKDAAIAASFSPYAADSLAQAQDLAARNVPVIAITDSAFSPLTRITGLKWRRPILPVSALCRHPWRLSWPFPSPSPSAGEKVRQKPIKRKWNKHSELTKYRNQCFITTGITAAGDGRSIHSNRDETNTGTFNNA